MHIRLHKLLALCLLASTPSALAQPSSANSISFQGALMGAGGQPLPNGNYNLTFKFYTNATTPTALATSNVPNVPVSGGLASTPIPMEASWFNNGQTRFLGMAINGGAELSPRVLITSVPYAVAANSLVGPVVYLNSESVIFNSTEVADPEAGFWSLQPHAFFAGQFGIVRYHPSADVTRSLVIGPNGNVGIGVDRAEATLDVAGFTQLRRGLVVQDILGHTALHVDTETGQVGIGGYITHAALDVYGTARMTVCQITSDRASKQEFAPVAQREILTKLAKLPLTTWVYTNTPNIRHIGPVAQDFAAAFGVGEDDKHIATVDADGVALASIQGLYQIVQEKDAKIHDLERRLEALERKLESRFAEQERP